MSRLFVKLLSTTLALFFGAGLTSVYALTESDFTNTGVVVSAPTQYENNDTNNNSNVLVQPKGMVIEKLADSSGLSTPTRAGDVIDYTITVNNIGLLGLTGVTVTDSIIPAPNMVLSAGDSNNDLVLDADEIWVYKGQYQITQADIDSFGGGDGDIDNSVTVSVNELDSLTDDAAVAITKAPSFTVEKVVDKTTLAAPGTLTYSITIANTGNTTLNNVAVTDTLPDGTAGVLAGPVADTGIANALDAGESWVFTTSYVATQNDIDAGQALVNNVAVQTTETGTKLETDSAQTTIVKSPLMVVSKQVDVNNIIAPGLLSYTIKIENTGNVTLNNVVPVDTLPDGGNATLTGPTGDAGTVGALDVGESWVFTTSYFATQANVDNGADLVNSVAVTSDETNTTIFDDTAVTTITASPSMLVSKVVDLATVSEPQLVNYTIAIENNGNVSLSNVAPVDTLPDGTTAVLSGPLNDIGLPGLLDVGEMWEFTTSYAISQAEIDAGIARTNVVAVTSDETGTNSIDASAVTTLARSPGFNVEKTVDLVSVNQPGALQYEITVSNTGNTSLTDIAVLDTLPDGLPAVLIGPSTDAGLPGVIDVGEVWTYTGEYTVTQGDIDAGLVLTNTVSVSTKEAGSQQSEAVTTVSQLPNITLSKAATEGDFSAPGNVINYTITVTNSGNVALSQIVVTDPIADAGSLSCANAMPFTLLPGQQENCSALRTITINDIAATEVVNQAAVSAADPAGNAVLANSNVVTLALLAIAPVAVDDSFVSPASAVAVTLDGAVDDFDSNGDLDTSSVSLVEPDAIDSDGDGDMDTLSVAGEGTWQVDNVTGEVTFTPAPGFSADPTPVSYVVSDATGLVSNVATLLIDYPQSAPVAKDDYKLNPDVESPDNPTTVDVLADNGNGVDSDPENDIDVQSVSLVSNAAVDTDGDGDKDTLTVAGNGTWVVDNLTGAVTFTPVAGFLADPSPVAYTVSDINGLVSNQALITVDYPQTAPVANNDEKLDQPLALPVTVATLANDSDPENNLDSTTVMLIDSETALPMTELMIPGEGVWRVDLVNGDITFTPESGFVSDPAPVTYTVKDTTGLESNPATVTVSFEEPATLEGIVWLDRDRDGEIDENEQRKPNWTLRIFNSDGVLVASTVTDANGYYLVTGLVPGAFTVKFYNENGVFMDSATTPGVVLAGQVVNLPLPVDPGGVVYDSISREPVAGVTLNMVNGNGELLHSDCLAENQQSQTTLDDGLYAFTILSGAHTTCPSTGLFSIAVANAPSDYYPNFSAILRQEGAADCGDATLGCATSAIFDAAATESNCTVDTLPNTNACEVQQQPDAPADGESTNYFVEFYLQSGDRNVIFNHLPIDAKSNDAQLLLSKTANKRNVSVGSLVEYTLFAENTKEVPAVDIQIVDQPPANFSLVAESIRLVRAGDDADFDTGDDVVKVLTPSELSPILFGAIDFEPLETVRVQYLMRVGPGVVSGAYANKASAVGPGGIASNTVSATVQVIPDPVLEQATLVGKVFNDRDADGAQDPADATGVALRSDYYGWNSLALPPLPGRNSVNDDPSLHATTVNMPITGSNRFTVVTREGTRISVDEQGNISEAHVGAKARGLNAQDIRVCTQHMTAVPTNKSGVTAVDGLETEVLQIVLQNYGINEEGIPGVRLATVTGLLIETDAYGRYSIPDVNAGNTGIGQNFVLKVDPATLPQGSTFTTENPYVLRIFNTSLNKINFGVKVPDSDPYINGNNPLCNTVENDPVYQTVEVSLGSVFFDTDKHHVRDDQRGIVLDIINKLREYGGGQIVIDAHTDSRGSYEYNLALAERRAETIRKILSESLGAELMQLISVEVSREARSENKQ